MTNKNEDTTDPFGDVDNISRSFPNRVDQSGTPDTQPDQPAEALGVGQVSQDSLRKEAEELENSASKGSKKEGLAELSEEEKLKASQKVKDGSQIEGGHSDGVKKQLEAEVDRAKSRDEAKNTGEDDDTPSVPEASQQRSVVDKDASKTAAHKK